MNEYSPPRPLLLFDIRVKVLLIISSSCFDACGHQGGQGGTTRTSRERGDTPGTPANGDCHINRIRPSSCWCFWCRAWARCYERDKEHFVFLLKYLLLTGLPAACIPILFCPFVFVWHSLLIILCGSRLRYRLVGWKSLHDIVLSSSGSELWMDLLITY